MTKKYDDFVKEMIELCDKHDVEISPDIYGNITVYDKDNNMPVGLTAPKFTDKTK